LAGLLLLFCSNVRAGKQEGRYKTEFYVVAKVVRVTALATNSPFLQYHFVIYIRIIEKMKHKTWVVN